MRFAVYRGSAPPAFICGVGNVIEFKPGDKRPPSLRHAEAVRQAQIAGGNHRAKGGRLSKEERELRAMRRIAEQIGVKDLEELADAFELEGPEAFRVLRPGALMALAKDLLSDNDQVRKAAWTRVLDFTDGKLAKEDDDAPKSIEFYTAALGDEREPEPTFSWD